MPPASAGMKCLLSSAVSSSHGAPALASSAVSPAHFLQAAQRQLFLHKHPHTISQAQPTQSQQSLGGLAWTPSLQTRDPKQALHKQQHHLLPATAATPASRPAPLAHALHTVSSMSMMQQQHPAYQQQLYHNTWPHQGHYGPLQLQPCLPHQQQLVHHHHHQLHHQHVQHHSSPHHRQHVRHHHSCLHHQQQHIHHYCFSHQQQQQQQQQRCGMATRSIPFVDRVRMVVEGGKGGNGCVSYAQVARGRRQAATGGNGGDGGSVVLRASRGARELRGLPRVVRGAPGEHGRPNGRTGAHGDTRVVDVPVGMVVSLLEDAPLEAELAPPTATMGCSTTTDQSIWAASPIRHQDTHTSSDTSSWRQSLHHIPADSDANTATGRSAQCAPLQSSLAGRNAASLADVGGSFPRRNDSQAGQSLWPVKEQGEASRHQRQNIEESEPDHSATEEARVGTRGSLRQQPPHLQQEGVMAGGGPMWERAGEVDSEEEEFEDDGDDVEVEEDEEEEDEDFEEGMGWEEGGGDEEVGEAERKPPQRLRVLAELLELGQQITVAVGGQGGSGNASTHSPSRSRFRPPSAREPSSEFTQGSSGTSATLVLELKMLADVGLVGMPNAGKSSLLKALTGARAKVGSYAFTTLHPQLGTIVGSLEPCSNGSSIYSSSSSSSNSNGHKSSSIGARSRQHAADEGSSFTPASQSLVLADIPGLISGAHEDRGRGNLFLRHVERVGCIAYVIDLSGGQTEANSLIALTPAEQLAVLQNELQAYRAFRQDTPMRGSHSTSATYDTGAESALPEPGTEGSPMKPFELVIANKVDACVGPQQALAELKEATHLPIIPVSAIHAAGLERLASALQAAVHSARSRC